MKMIKWSEIVQVVVEVTIIMCIVINVVRVVGDICVNLVK